MAEHPKTKIVVCDEAYNEASKKMIACLQEILGKNPKLTILELLAVMGQMAGVALAACYPSERDLAWQTVVTNMHESRLNEAAKQAVAGQTADRSGRA